MSKSNHYRSHDPDYRRQSSDHQSAAKLCGRDEGKEQPRPDVENPPELIERSFGAGRIKEDYGESRRPPKRRDPLPLAPDEIRQAVDSSNDLPGTRDASRPIPAEEEENSTAIGQESDTHS